MFLLLGLTLLGCATGEDPNYIRMSDQIINLYIKDMKEQYGLKCFGSGGGFLNKVNEIIISFETQGPKNKKELRELVIKINEDLLKRYNENEEIRPYLKNYPFTAKNLRIGILLTDEKGNAIHNKGSNKEGLRAVYQSWGNISYQVKNDEKPNPQDVFEETYEEALSIVKNNYLEGL
jgi:hypothetical protein